jgi:hypothetical protein
VRGPFGRGQPSAPTVEEVGAPAARHAAPGGGVSLEDKYRADRGVALISGIEALVRLTLVQRRLDAARHLNTAVYVS